MDDVLVVVLCSSHAPLCEGVQAILLTICIINRVQSGSAAKAEWTVGSLDTLKGQKVNFSCCSNQ